MLENKQIVDRLLIKRLHLTSYCSNISRLGFSVDVIIVNCIHVLDIILQLILNYLLTVKSLI